MRRGGVIGAMFRGIFRVPAARPSWVAGIWIDAGLSQGRQEGGTNAGRIIEEWREGSWEACVRGYACTKYGKQQRRVGGGSVNQASESLGRGGTPVGLGVRRGVSEDIVAVVSQRRWLVKRGVGFQEVTGRRTEDRPPVAVWVKMH